MYGGQFSHTRFSLNTGEDLEIVVSVSFSDTLKNVSGFGVVTNIEETFFDRLNNNSRVTPTMSVLFDSMDSLQSRASLFGGMLVEFSAKDALSMEAYAIVQPTISVSFMEELGANIWVGKDMFLSDPFVSFVDNVLSKPTAAKDMVYLQQYTDILNCYVSTVILDVVSLSISAEIPAGSTLEIDSETYDVFLDGVNILHLHDGDWIVFDRDTVDLSVDSGTGGAFDGSVLYEERYL